MIKAYSYLRFSTPEQATGDSFRRQTKAAADYAARYGLDLDTSLRFSDLGVSAFRGKNAVNGQLRQFLRAVEDGIIAPDSYLLVENFDRLSRQNPWQALPTFQAIINLGVTIVTLQDEKVWAEKELRENPYRIMESLLVMLRANEESAVKSDRLRKKWGELRKEASVSHKVLTTRAPKWLKVSTDDRGIRFFAVLEDRAAVVRRVFALALEGVGQHRIAEILNAEAVPTFDGGKHWHRSIITKWLRYPAVVGTYVPHVIEHSEARKSRKPLEPIPNYYPAIITQDVWERVQSLHGADLGAVAPRVRKSGVGISNLLAGLASCPLCGGTMTRVMKGSKKGGKPYLVCVKAKVGAGCEYYGVNQDAVERALVDMRFAIHEAALPIDDDLAKRKADITGELDGTRDEISNLLTELGRAPSPLIRSRLDHLEARSRELEVSLAVTMRQLTFGSEGLLQQKLADLVSTMSEAPVQAAKTNAVLRQLFSKAVIDWRTAEIVLHWRHRPRPEDILHFPYSWDGPKPPRRKRKASATKATTRSTGD